MSWAAFRRDLRAIQVHALSIHFTSLDWRHIGGCKLC
jgi:hypothetical protein